ncbi:helix-turn-helix domain-containing protein [Chryseobacterium gallinarum]|uniref:helix-turn-helix domain-containing protein n=1 Tax=Chryseobacterium gallinarum TaxID=1324352 RepID=UPI002023F7E0|nr:helix-turn-helix domain-containing protein [Chryseobacterium gallinarum]MCL8537673.1 helix-turn-helix domain-containing protein [Chryseobacterium gallinarum]
MIVTINISKKWLRKATDIFPGLKTELEDFLNRKVLSNTPPPVAMDKSMDHFIRGLKNKEHTITVDGFMRFYIPQILGHYDRLVREKRKMLAYRVRNYLDVHYKNPDVDTAFLADLFHVTQRTLRNQFRQAFHVTIYSYYTNLRLQLANTLIQAGNPVKEVYYQVGYRDERSFRYAYSRRWNNASPPLSTYNISKGTDGN